MKRILSLLCALSIAASLTACSTKPQENGGENGSAQSTTQNQSGGNSSAEKLLQEKSSYVTFGHISLGVQAHFPDLDLLGSLSSNGMMVYPHGFTLADFVVGQDVYELSVEMSLEGETDLARLPIAISDEKGTVPDVTNDETSFGLRRVTALDRTDNVQVGDYQAVYFEIDSPGEDKYTDRAVMGYSFVFEGKPVCVTAYYGEHKKYTKEEIQEILQYMMLTLESYHGEAFYELQPDNHINEFYNNYKGPVVDKLLVENAKGFTLFGHARGTRSYSAQSDAGMHSNDLLYPYDTVYMDEPTTKCEELLKEGLAYDEIFPLALESETLKKELDLWTNNEVTIEKEEDVTVHGIAMKRYEARVSMNDTALSDFWVVYTFIYEDVPYLWRMDTNNVSIFKMNEEEAKYVMDTVRLQADTVIRTIDLKQ